MFLDHMKCYSGKYEYQIIQKDPNIITSHCGCSAHTILAANTKIHYKNSDNTVVFATKSTWTSFIDNSKQICGYVPKVKFTDSTIEITCGYHPHCAKHSIQTLGYINLI